MGERHAFSFDPPPVDASLPSTRELDLGEGESITLCWVPPGTSWIGSRDRPYPDERPAHRLRVARGFWLGSTPVTRGQWRAVKGVVPEPAFEGLEEPDRHPVVHVSWYEALEFCANLQARFLPREPAPVGPPEELARAENCGNVTWHDGPGFRLPSEGEWEHACRGAGRLARGLAEAPFGDGEEVLERRAWYFGNSAEQAHAADSAPEPGGDPPHPLGLHQMIGNVNEWCLDLYRAERWKELRPNQGQAAHGGRAGDRATLSEPIDAEGVLQRAEADELGQLGKQVLDLVRSAAGRVEGLSRLQAVLDERVPAGERTRVLRGGSWVFRATGATSPYRSGGQPGVRNGGIGFRVCLSPRPSTAAGPERRRTGPVTPGGARSGADPCADAEAAGQRED